MIELHDYSEMFESNPMPQAVLDGQTRFIQVNEAFCRLTGYPADRLIGIPFGDVRTKGMITFLEDSGEGVADAVRLRRKTVGNSRIKSPSGTYVIIRTNIPLYTSAGELRQVYITYDDVTKVTKNQDYMSKVIREYQKVYAQAAAGDLTLRYDQDEPDDDTRETYNQLILLRDAVRGIIASLKTNINDVNTRMKHLTDNVEATTRTIDEASAGISQIARDAGDAGENAKRSLQGIEEIARAMQDMSATVEEITSSVENVSTQANLSKDAAKNGAVLLDSVNTGMNDIFEATKNIYHVVEDIARQMADITKIIVLIRDLANQTNLLALNAAIEAARAGEHGRGFAVVASEVKSLAQESRASAEKIEEMITGLNSSTKKAIDVMEVSKTLVIKGRETSAEALTAFKEIETSSEQVAKNAAEVAAATEEQAATTEEITASTQEVANLIKTTSSQMVDIAAATEESSAAVDEITRMAANVGQIAGEAMEANRKFRVN